MEIFEIFLENCEKFLEKIELNFLKFTEITTGFAKQASNNFQNK